MGSSNFSCAFTGAPIYYGDEARLIFVAMNPASVLGGTALHTTHFWKPLSFPIPVVYEDYQHFRLIDAGDWRFDMLKRGPLHSDAPAFPVAATLSELCELVRAGSLRMTSSKTPSTRGVPETVPVSLMVVSEEAYTVMSEGYEDCGDRFTASDIADAAPEAFAWVRDLPDHTWLRAQDAPYDEHFHWFLEGIGTSASPSIFCLRDAPCPTDVKYLIHSHTAGGFNPNSDALQEIYAALSEMICMGHNMDDLSIPYRPSQLASDDYDHSFQARLHDVARKAWQRED